MAAILLSTVVPAMAGYNYDLNIYINGIKMSSPDQKPYLDTDLNRVYVPVRFVTEALGATVDWNDETQTAVIKRGDTIVKIKIGSNSPLVNDSFRILDATAVLMNGRTMVPLRFISEAFGAKITWDEGQKLVHITDSSNYNARNGIILYKGYDLPNKTDLIIEKTPMVETDNVEINIILSLKKPLPQQHKDLYDILASKFGSLAKLISGYAELKTVESYELQYKRFVSDDDKYVITVSSAAQDYSVYISVKNR